MPILTTISVLSTTNIFPIENTINLNNPLEGLKSYKEKMINFKQAWKTISQKDHDIDAAKDKLVAPSSEQAREYNHRTNKKKRAIYILIFANRIHTYSSLVQVFGGGAQIQQNESYNKG